MPEISFEWRPAAWQFDLDFAALAEWLARYAAEWRFDFDVVAMGEQILSHLSDVYRQVAHWDAFSLEFTMPGALKLPPVLAWTSLAGVLTVLLAFNGLQARMLRTGTSIDSGAPRPAAAPGTKGDDSC
jgi:hypothetical protein